MRSITIDELRSEVEGYIEAAKSAKGESAMGFLNRQNVRLEATKGGTYAGIREN